MNYWKMINEAVIYIEEHIKGEVDADILAGNAGYSKYHFLRIFKEYTSMPVMKYIRIRRLIYAIMEFEDKTMLDIALQYGFDTQTGFIKAFKRIYNDTPKNYRIKVLGMNSRGSSFMAVEKIRKGNIMKAEYINNNVLEKVLITADKIFNLTQHGNGKYSYDFWRENFIKHPELMVYSQKDNAVNGFMLGWAGSNTVTLAYDWVDDKSADSELKTELLHFFEEQVKNLEFEGIALGVMAKDEDFCDRK